MSLLTQLRSRQLQLLTTNSDLESIDKFYEEVVTYLDQGKLSKIEIYKLFTDLFEDCPEKRLRELFQIFERLVAEHIQLPADHLHHCTRVIKIILQRLTVTHDLVFRGTLQKFMTQVMPLSHKSGVNLNGLFNEANTTQIEPENIANDDTNEQSVAAAAGGSKKKQQQVGSEYKTYKMFWSIQQYLINPPSVFKQDEVAFDFEEEIPDPVDKMDVDQAGQVAGSQDYVDMDEPQNSKETKDQKESKDQKEQVKNEPVSQIHPVISTSSAQAAQTQKPQNSEPKKKNSNLQQVLKAIRFFLDKFTAQPLPYEEKQSARILERYPKYLSKFSLVDLQFNDRLFRETFLTQTLIFLQTILNPMEPKLKTIIKLTDQEREEVVEFEKLIQQFFLGSTQTKTETKSQKEKCLAALQSEQSWVAWKKNKCMPFERVLQGDGINQKIQKLREMKAANKAKFYHPGLKNRNVIQEAREFNQHKGYAAMHQALRAPVQIDPPLPLACNHYVQTVLQELDPAQCVEDEYKAKNDKLFSWRCLRAIVDHELKNFSFEWSKGDSVGRDGRKQIYKFEGNIEELCLNLYWPLKRREIIIESAECDNDKNEEEEDQEMFTEAEREQLNRIKDNKQRMWQLYRDLQSKTITTTATASGQQANGN